MDNRTGELVRLVMRSLICLQDLSIQKKLDRNTFNLSEFIHYWDRNREMNDGLQVDERAKILFEDIQKRLREFFHEDELSEIFKEVFGELKGDSNGR